MSRHDDKSGIELLCIIVGSLTLLVGIEAATWYAARGLSLGWFVGVLVAGNMSWYVIKEVRKSIRARRDQSDAMQSLLIQALLRRQSQPWSPQARVDDDGSRTPTRVFPPRMHGR